MAKKITIGLAAISFPDNKLHLIDKWGRPLCDRYHFLNGQLFGDRWYDTHYGAVMAGIEIGQLCFHCQKLGKREVNKKLKEAEGFRNVAEAMAERHTPCKKGDK
jgi:hypothetical protein